MIPLPSRDRKGATAEPNASAATPRHSPSGIRVLVLGLGRFGGGVGVTRWLASCGASVTVTDQASAQSLADSVEAIRDLGVELELGGHTRLDRARFDLVVVSPAVRPDSDVFRELLASGIAYTTEINLFLERCPASVIAVTGSYGKSTTCAMLAHALRATAGQGDLRHGDVHLGGNIGGSLLNDLQRITARDVVVLELSNAQLEHTPRIAWRPVTAVITNIHPHHLDRYDSFVDYARVKLNVLGSPQMTQRLVLGPVHDEAAAMVDQVAARVERVISPEVAEGLPLKVPGGHNRANAACAMAACRLLELKEDSVTNALADFPGLPHRLEFVRAAAGVNYINDSKSTAPQATVMALRAVEEWSGTKCQGSGAMSRRLPGRHDTPQIVLILGGLRKPEPLEDMPREITRLCSAAICIGECGPDFAAAIQATGGTAAGSRLRIDVVPSLDEAVRRATELASPGTTVLFSPGAPSFDAYANFAERGAHFIRLVRGLTTDD